MSANEGTTNKVPPKAEESQPLVQSVDEEKDSPGRKIAGNSESLSDRLGGLSISQDENEGHCSICRDAYVHPVQLPCKHKYCYLCIKGATARSGRCALCRQAIPADYLDRPGVVDASSIEAALKKADAVQWFYEARNGGWWMYEERTSQEIERAYTQNEEKCTVQILGFNYVVDFKESVQYRSDIPTRRRKIKRDKVGGGVKGVAGAWLPPPPTTSGK